MNADTALFALTLAGCAAVVVVASCIIGDTKRRNDALNESDDTGAIEGGINHYHEGSSK